MKEYKQRTQEEVYTGFGRGIVGKVVNAGGAGAAVIVISLSPIGCGGDEPAQGSAKADTTSATTDSSFLADLGYHPYHKGQQVPYGPRQRVFTAYTDTAGQKRGARVAQYVDVDSNLVRLVDLEGDGWVGVPGDTAAKDTSIDVVLLTPKGKPEEQQQYHAKSPNADSGYFGQATAKYRRELAKAQGVSAAQARALEQRPRPTTVSLKQLPRSSLRR